MGNIIQPLWADCPALTRLVCASVPAMSLMILILSMTPLASLLQALFVCNVRMVQSFHIWTLFTSFFWSQMFGDGMSFLMGLFQIYMTMIYFPTKEREMGSTTFALWLFSANGLINVVYLSMMFVMSCIFQDFMSQQMYLNRPNMGLWPLTLLTLSLRSLSDPEGSSSFWGIVTIPNKWYPLALLGLFSLMNGLRILWDFVAAIIVAYAYVRFNFDRFMPSSATGGKLEQKISFLRSGRMFLGAAWLPANSTASYGMESAADRRYATLNDFSRTSGQSLTQSAGVGEGPGFKVFSGQGNVLGEGEALQTITQQDLPAAPPGTDNAAGEP